MTPPPITASVLGIFFRLRAPVELTINFSSILLIFSAVSLSFFFYFFINKTLNGETEEIVEIMFIDRAISISLFSFSIFFILGIT